MIIKPKGPVEAVTTANNVSNALLVRIYADNAALITMSDSGGQVLGSFPMAQYATEIVEKRATDRIAADASVSCTPVSYKG